jgi:hypothetical protein
MITYHPSFVVRWWVLVHCGQNLNKTYLSKILMQQKVCEIFVNGDLLALPTKARI